MATNNELANQALALGASPNAIATLLNTENRDPSQSGAVAQNLAQIIQQLQAQRAAAAGAAPGVGPASIFPQSVPSLAVASPSITPVSIGSPGSTPVATGVDLWMKMMDYVLKSEQLRQTGIDQTVGIAKYATDLAGVSPAKAADLSVQLGIPGLEPNLSYLNRYVNDSTSGVVSGQVGTQNVSLPFAFNGRELSGLSANPTVANVLQSVATRFGRPDILKTSSMGLLPSVPGLAF